MVALLPILTMYVKLGQLREFAQYGSSLIRLNYEHRLDMIKSMGTNEYD